MQDRLDAGLREVEHEQEDIYRAEGSEPAADPSARRGFGWLAMLGFVIGGLAGLIVGAIIAVASGNGWAILAGALAGATVGAPLAMVIAAEMEDGRVARRVRRRHAEARGRT